MLLMGRGRPRAVEKGGGLGQIACSSGNGTMNVPLGPVYYPNEEEFKDPLGFIYKIRAEAEPYGICKIVPPKSWKPPFALDLNKFRFPTKTQAIHQLQARPASCDSKTFELEYNRFLEARCGRKTKRKVVFEGEELDLCKLFNAVKRFGGYDKVVKDKKWGEVFRFVRSGRKISECAKHVLCQLYREHLYDYEDYYNKLNNGEAKNCKRGTHIVRKSDRRSESSSSKKRRKINHGEVVKLEVEEKVESRDQICVQCKSGLHGEVMLLCDRCNKGWHTYCLSPPLEAIPLGNWYCLECLNSDKDSFGFVPGKHFSLEAFRRVADRTKKRWFGQASCSPSQLEKKFWEIVEGSLGEVEVMYGSDLDTSIYGSGFPRANDQRLESVDTEIWDEYCSSPWNLNNLPKLKDSMLRTVHHSIAGVMVPWLYIGMLFSAFCWHFEDHCFYSMNYHHWGEPKCWYSVPGSEASTFEKVMRSCLPDLFDSQPDLLFQLVTMLNPSVLQENGVPVYGVLQEPGNFVITFPRSYHGGFNLGLNCAEAVNFAPADWLPHGGFGAELYQTYHKPAVLSHEELLCVVAKTGCDEKVSFYLNKELLRVFSKEKNWREKLWKKGVVKTSVMSPRSHPEFVGTEEDPICIICQQYLYLSAVVCCCRPSTFVCLEHWEHLCECNPKKRCLLYRHSLAELNELLARTGNVDCDENPTLRSLQRQSSCSTDSGTLTKKVKCRQVSLAQLAEEWLLSSCKIFQLPFSSDAYAKALKAAQQFLWAGSEMDPVRDMVKNLSEAKDWAESVRQCLSLVEKWSDNSESDLEKVHLERISNLLKYDPAPCTEPGYPKLKDYAEGARKLVQEICDGLSESPLSISELEHLYDKANGFPIHVKESDKLLDKISSAKACVGNVRKCVLETCPSAVEMDTLHHLKSKIVELQVQVPETEMLLDIIRKAELCQTRCKEMLKDQFTLKELELLIHDFGSLVVNIPEFKLLQQYHSDAISWISRFNQIQNNIHEREDHENVVKELECIQKDAAVLRVQVDELALVDFELKRACCREKAAKARSTKMPLDFIKQVLSEAFMLQIEKEKLFVSISEALGVALSWEDCAQQILSIQAHMRDFEDAMRTSEDLFVVLPSLNAIKNAVSAAKSWLESSKPFLKIGSYASDSLLSFDALKEQVSHSKHLKVLLEERMAIENVLQKCEEWRNCASSLLKDVGNLLNKEDNCNILGDDLMLKTEELLNRVESVKATGTSMGFDFSEISELQNACSSLQWCGKVLSFRFKIPSLKEVNSLIEVVNELAPVYRNAFLCTLLLDGITWLKKVTEVLPASSNGRGGKRFQLADAAEILMESQKIRVSFPVIIRQIEQAIEKHRTWEEEVNAFFGLNSSERSWSSLLLLKELGKDAFCCKELDMVLSEVEMVEKWKQRSEEVVGSSNRDVASLSKSLLKIKQSMHRSLYIYKKSKCSKVGYFCTGCSNNSEDQEFMTCSSCKDCYHLRCLVPTLVGINDPKVYVCPYCVSVESGSICRSRDSPLRFKGKRPELERLVELSSDAKEFSVSNEEKDTLQEIVDQALVCRANLSDIVDSVLTFLGQDLSSVSGKLTIAFKALDVAGVYDPLASHKFDLALARSSWRIRASKLLDGSQKPLIQHIQRHLKEGSAINIPPEDYYRQKLIEVKQAGTRWAEIAKKVATDNGELELDSVFELIEEGENLPVHFEKELKQLRDRSVLYCICRKPYDQRAMIACDECDEWYHFDCVNLVSPPKVYICPACDPQQEGKILFSMKTKQERSVDGKDGEPQTPSPRHTASRWRPRKAKPSRKQKQVVVAGGSSGSDRFSGGLDQLLWTNRKPFRRVAKKRADLGSLSLFFAS